MKKAVKPGSHRARIDRTLAQAQHDEQLRRDMQRDERTAKQAQQIRLLDKKNKLLAEDNENLRGQVAFKTQIQAQRDELRFRRLASKPHSESTGILPLNDWHVEEKVEAERVNCQNEYCLDIAHKRAMRVFQKAVEMIDWLQSFATMRQLVVPLLGDFISGYIHPELVEVCSLAPPRATMFAQELLIEGLRFILREQVGIKSILIPAVPGNHARTTEKMRVATSTDNSFETMLYQNMEHRLRDESRVAFQIAAGDQALIETQGRKLRCTHGHEFRFGGGVGGITIPVNKQIDRWSTGMRVDYDLFGHWHQFKRDSRFIACGCLIGTTPYGMRYGYEPPSQTFLVVNRRHGLIFAEPIFVEDIADYDNDSPRRKALEKLSEIKAA